MSMEKQYVMRDLVTQCYYNKHTKKFDGNIQDAALLRSTHDCELTLKYDVVTSKSPHFKQGLIRIELIYVIDI